MRTPIPIDKPLDASPLNSQNGHETLTPDTPQPDSLALIPPTMGRVRARTEAEIAHALAALDELAAWEARHEHTPRLSLVVAAIRRGRADLRATERRARVPPPGAPYYALFRCVRASDYWQEPHWRRHLIANADRPRPSRFTQRAVVVTLCGFEQEVPDNYVSGSAFIRRCSHYEIKVGDVAVGPLDRTPTGMVLTCLWCEGRFRKNGGAA